MQPSQLIDLREFSRDLMGRRNRAALLLTTDVGTQRACAANIAAVIGAYHLDLLDNFIANAALAEQLSTFSQTDFFDLLAEHRERPLLVVSGIEFVLALWLCQSNPKQVKRNFCQQIELWERVPAFFLVTQYDPVFASYQPARHRGGPVTVEISKTQALT